VMSQPSRRTAPRSGSTSRLMQRRSVDFPAPERPMTKTASLPSTVNDTPRSAASPRGYRFSSASTSSTAPGLLARGLAELRVVLRLPREGDAVGLEDADHRLLVLRVAHRHEAGPPLELLAEARALELEGEEGFLDLLDERRLEIVRVEESRRRKH